MWSTSCTVPFVNEYRRYADPRWSAMGSNQCDPTFSGAFVASGRHERAREREVHWYRALAPALMSITEPVMWRAAGLARNTMTSETSLGSR